MLSPILVVTPAHRNDLDLAVAAARWGACVFLDLDCDLAADATFGCVEEFLHLAGRGRGWALRWDISASGSPTPAAMAKFAESPVPAILIGGIKPDLQHAREVLAAVRGKARLVLAEAYCVEGAMTAEAAGFDGLVLVGHEADRTQPQSAFTLLQATRGRLRVPYWVRGLPGPWTAAAAVLTGARGIVLGDQLHLAEESSVSARQRRQWSRLQGSPTEARGRSGQEIFCAADLARHHGTAGRILSHFRSSIGESIAAARRQSTLGSDSPSDETAGTRPRLMQALTAESGTAVVLAESAAAAGVLPVLQAGMLRRLALEELLGEVAVRLDSRPWGVGLLGYLPEPLYRQQQAALSKSHPACVILSGGRPDQARALEAAGMATYLGVDSPQSLERALAQGTARLLLEGREATGRDSSATSAVLWQTTIDRLLTIPITDSQAVEVVFAVDTLDALAAATVAAVASPLVERGFRIGALATGEPRAIETRSVSEAMNGPPADHSEHGLADASGCDTPSLHDNPGPMSAYKRLAADSLGILDEATARHKAESRPRTIRRRAAEPLAIVGIGCLFPKSPGVREYWQNILRGFDAVTETPAGRWSAEHFFDANRLTPDRFYSKWGAFLDEIVFDPLRYQIPPASLASIEPIQLMALEVARQALEDAGIQRPDFPRKRTAVIFATAGSHDQGLHYGFRTLMRHWLPKVPGVDPSQRERIFAELERRLPRWTEDSFPGFLLNVVAGRISNRFNLTGSNFVVDAACASSLAALETAAHQLRSGTCDAALVGAVDGTNNPFCFMSFAKTHAMSPRGRSRPFDESADGVGLGEGIAAVVVRRLRDAERQGDRIVAVIRGIGSSSDGTARSLTAPFADGQLLAVRRAYRQAGRRPAGVTLIEAHGTGTSVGDKVEVQALTEVFVGAGARPRGCAIGSIKSMIGHTKSVAGIASLVKTALALQQRVLPPTIGVERPIETLRRDDCPFYISTEPRPWLRRDGQPRRAGVSAFGFGGTNFHVVLEEYTGRGSSGRHIDLLPRAAEVFAFRRASRDEVLAALRRLDDDLAATEATARPEGDANPAVRPALAELAAAVHHDESLLAEQPGHKPACRLAIVATGIEELREKIRLASSELATKTQLENPTGIYYSEAVPVGPEQVCFLFPGQGSQAVNMFRDLVLGSPWAWPMLEQADRQLAPLLGQPVTEALYPPSAMSDDDRQRQQQHLNDTRLAQPALGLVELFVCELLARLGVRPAMVGGHSYGECVALCVAGVHTPEDLLMLSAERGRAVHQYGNTVPGGMATVFADGKATVAAMEKLGIEAHIANYNADVQTVIAAPVAVIDEAVKKLSKAGLRTSRIPVTAAFHTPAVQKVREVMDGHFARVTFHAPRLPVYSNVTAAPYPAGAEAMRRQLGEHLTAPVQFVRQIDAMYQAGARLFLEVGPGGAMTSLVRRNLKGRSFVALPLDATDRDGWLHLAHVAARLLAMGLAVELDGWFDGRGLGDQPAADYLAGVRGRNRRRPTDWIVGPGGARPATPRVAPQPAAPATIDPPTATLNVPSSRPQSTAAALVPAPRPSDPRTQVNLEPRPSMETPAMQRHEVETDRTATAAGTSNGDRASELIAQFQSTMAQWLEYQREQQQLSHRFLATQESIMLACLQDGEPRAADGVPMLTAEAPRAPAPRKYIPASVPAVARPPVAAPVPHAVETAAAPVAPPAAPPRPAPAAVAPKPAAPPATIAAAPAPAPAPTPPAAPAPAPAPKPPAAAAPVAASNHRNGSGAPSLETFKTDLLDAIADRTGYPIDMLDEKLELEAGLGIDSIKTIEIFGQLSKYHAYLPGAGDDQEQSLAAFARLRTIRDILDSYETNASQQRQTAASGNGHSEAGPADGAPKRLVPQAVEAPATDGQKKNSSHAVTSS